MYTLTQLRNSVYGDVHCTVYNVQCILTKESLSLRSMICDSLFAALIHDLIQALIQDFDTVYIYVYIYIHTIHHTFTIQVRAITYTLIMTFL